jgi:hypothetical protein
MTSSIRSRALKAINSHGALLVFPIKNTREPPSLWYELHPRTKMRWEWDQDGDTRVHDLWHLREGLSRSGQVVYGKFYKGRATFYSKKVFTLILAILETDKNKSHLVSPYAKRILEILNENSPLPTKKLKKYCELQGRDFESDYNRALKELWQKHLIVGWGEAPEGAFPSLNIGSTQLLFEELWNQAKVLEARMALLTLRKLSTKNSIFKLKL